MLQKQEISCRLVVDLPDIESCCSSIIEILKSQYLLQVL